MEVGDSCSVVVGYQVWLSLVCRSSSPHQPHLQKVDLRGSRRSLSQSSPIPQPAPKNLAKIDLEPWTQRKQPRQRQLDNHRQNENVRRFFLRPADLPRQGTNCPFLRLRPTANSPSPSQAATRQLAPKSNDARRGPGWEIRRREWEEDFIVAQKTTVLTVFCSAG